MAKLKKLVRSFGEKISRKELNQLTKAAGSVGAALNQISAVQSSMKSAGKTAPSIGSAAANMMIKQAQATPAGVYQLGSSKLAQTIRNMAGTPGVPFTGRTTSPIAAKPPSGLGYVPEGMVIRPSGRIGLPKVNKASGAVAQVGDTVSADAAGSGQTYDDFGGDFGGDFGMDLGGYGDFFGDMGAGGYPTMEDFSALSSDVATKDPLQLASLGQAYIGEGIRGRRRSRKTRRDYRRSNAMGGLAPMAPASSLAIGGLTL
jgi:hypothetical protein